MFATRSHNENAIYNRQTAAAAKSLNNSGGDVKGLAPKTPGQRVPPPKTPFKVPLNDENATVLGGKTGGTKAKDGGLFGSETTSGKAERSAFQTPAVTCTTTRAPLGNKTTNAKLRDAKSQQQQQQQQQQQSHSKLTPTTKTRNGNKSTSPRLRRQKLNLHQKEGEAAHPLRDDGEREIEYMPPRSVPLPDDPTDCWPVDRTYPQFEGINFCRGWASELDPPRDEDELSDFEEKVREIERRERKGKKDPGTVKARHAAGVLGSSGRVTMMGNKARMPFTADKKKSLHEESVAGNPRHTAARAASKTTLGYSQGRRTVSGMKNCGAAGLSTRDSAVCGKRELVGGGVALDGFFKITGGVEQEEEKEEALKGCLGVEDELEGFQLTDI